MKKLNDQTGGYKIDIFVNGAYICSTDWNKKCKDAKKRYLELNPKVNPQTVKCNFAKI